MAAQWAAIFQEKRIRSGLLGRLIRRSLRCCRLLAADAAAHLIIDHRADRNTQHHTGDAAQSAADDDSEEHPESRKSHGLAHHMRIDQVACTTRWRS